MIRIFITGGTFDKYYNELTGELSFKESHVPKLLERSRTTLPITISQLMLIDSLDMTENHRHQILTACQACPESQIIITHGTDTLIQTAKLLKQNIFNKTIILTGAMIPVRISNSDGLFNLGSALATVQILKDGVYIAMNGQIFDPDNVIKNKQIGVFQPLT